MDLNSRQIAAQKQFDQQSFHYGSSHQILSQLEDFKSLFQHVSIPCNARALDVATGGGHTALFLAKMGCEVTASDISEAMLGNAAQLAAKEGFSIHTRQHTAEELPYSEKSFDIVSCRVAAHHFTDLPRFLQEAARVLIPGGFLFIIDTTIPSDSPEAAQWLDCIEKLRDPSHVRLISTAEWLLLCQQAGLEPQFWQVTSVKQPDLEEHFRRANTSVANRKAVLRLVEEAPPIVRDIYHLSQKGGKITWFWPRLGLIARKL